MEELRDHLAQRLDVGRRGHQRRLRPGVEEHAGAGRVPLLVVAVDHRRARPAVDRTGELPPQVGRIVEARAEPGPARRHVNVCRVAREEDAARSIELRLPAAVGEAREPAGLRHPDPGAVDPLDGAGAVEDRSHPLLVLGERGEGETALHLCSELLRALQKQHLRPRLVDREGAHRRRHRDAGEAASLRHVHVQRSLPKAREEAAKAEQVDPAALDAERLGEAGRPLELLRQKDPHPPQSQLAGEQEPHGPRTDDQHLRVQVLRHLRPSSKSGSHCHMALHVS
jgi:hypothetical protein